MKTPRTLFAVFFVVLGLFLGSEAVNVTVTCTPESCSVPEGGDITFHILVQSTNSSEFPVQLVYATDGGSATAETDYNALSNTTWNVTATEQTQDVTISTYADTVEGETDEDFNLVVYFRGDQVSTSATIQNIPAISITSSAASAEGTQVELTVSLLYGSSLESISVNYTTQLAITGPHLASAGDFEAAADQLQWIEGNTDPKTITVDLVQDSMYEPNETFLVVLFNPSGATIASPTEAVVSITNDDYKPDITITSVPVTEHNNTQSTQVTVTVTMNSTSYEDVTISWSTSDEDPLSAKAGEDYTAAFDVISIPSGSLSESFEITILGDDIYESTETFLVTFTTEADVTLPASHTVTILDNEAYPTLTIDDVVLATEGDAGQTQVANFNVSVVPLSAFPISVKYTTTNNTATGPPDFEPQSLATLNIPALSAMEQISIVVNGDDMDEPNEEFFFVDLSDPVGAVIQGGQGRCTITDDDSKPTIDISTGHNVTEGNSGTKNVVFTVELTNPSADPITVDYRTDSGTATPGADFLPASGTLTFLSGETVHTVTVTIDGDDIYETDETFFVILGNLSASATPGNMNGTGIIHNDDQVPSLEIDDVLVTETDSGLVEAVFWVSLSNPSQMPVSVHYATANGTAGSGQDYLSVSDQLVWEPFSADTKNITVQVIGDNVHELVSENFFVDLSLPSGATVAVGRGTATVTDNDPVPTISINNSTVTEGNNTQSTVNAVFTVSLSNPSYQTINVSYATADNTATVSGQDYQAALDELVWEPYTSAPQSVTVLVRGDQIYETTETFFVTLSDNINADILVSQGVGTILDDEDLPAISVSDISVSENATNAIFNLTLSIESAFEITVQYMTGNGTAFDSSDFQAAQGTATFAPLTFWTTVTVAVQSDSMDEPDETFTLNLSTPEDATIAVSQATCTIRDDDPLPTISITSVSMNEGNSVGGTVDFVFDVTLTNPSSQQISVNFTTSDGTAQVSNQDYTESEGRLVFNSGELFHQIVVKVDQDDVYEANETFTVDLFALSATAEEGVVTATGTILNDDPIPTISIDDATVTEGNSGTKDAVFTVVLSNPSYQTITVNYTTVSNNATEDEDYESLSDMFTFPAYSSNITRTIAVKVIGDLLFEGTETFFVDLHNNTNSMIGRSRGVGTILDNESTITVAVENVQVVEGDTQDVEATFNITLSGPSASTIVVDYDTANGTAVEPVDFLHAEGDVTFPPGTVWQLVNVTVKPDTMNEFNETFTLVLSNPRGAQLEDTFATCTIIDNDMVPSVSISEASHVEGNSSYTQIVFNVTLSNPSSQSITVAYATQDGTATVANRDYNSTSGVLTFSSGEVMQTISVPVVGDLAYEANENFTVVLSSLNGAVAGDLEATGTIFNDDEVPTVSILNTTVTEMTNATAQAAFTVVLSNPSYETITVKFATSDGTAEAPNDYENTTGIVEFLPYSSGPQNITIDVLDDNIHEGPEYFSVLLSSPMNATIAASEAFASITDTDAQPEVLVQNVIFSPEGEVNTTALVDFTITLSRKSFMAITVEYMTVNGTATWPADFEFVHANVTFPAMTLSQIVSIPVHGDDIREHNETFGLKVLRAWGATVTSADQGNCTIIDDDPLPTVSLSTNSTSVVEGNAGDVSVIFTVSLSNPSSDVITVQYKTENGTATSPQDFTAASGTLTFLGGETSHSVPVLVHGDTAYELNETFAFVLFGLSNNSLPGDLNITEEILNDDSQPTISINNVNVTEGNNGTTPAVFQVKLSNPSYQVVRVNFTTVDNTSTTEDNDYQFASGQLTFPPYSSGPQTITVLVNGDTIQEQTREYFFVDLSEPINANISVGRGLGTIRDDENMLSIFINSIQVVEGNSTESLVNATFTISLSGVSSFEINVEYATANGTATEPADFVFATGTVAFEAGAQQKNVTVQIRGDTMRELNETFTLELFNPDGALLAQSHGNCTIVDDDPIPVVSIMDAAVNEGNVSTVNSTFTVSLTNPSYDTITVNYTTVDSSATSTQPRADYVFTSGMVTFLPGETVHNVLVAVNGDVIYEPDEAFFVQLSHPSNNTVLGDFNATGMIFNDDSIPTLSIGNTSVTENDTSTVDAVFVVTISNPSYQQINVSYQTETQSADQSDFEAATGQLTFPPFSSANQTITIRVTGDVIYEGNEIFLVVLSNATNSAIANAQGFGTIIDNEALPTLSINSVSVVEPDDGTVVATLTVTLSRSSFQTITVNYTTLDGTATAPSDYLSKDGMLTFDPFVTSVSLNVTINGDNLNEVNETVRVLLSNPVRAVLDDSRKEGVITITDDDVVGFNVTSTTVVEGNSSTVNAIFTVTLSGPSSRVLSVNYSTVDNTATSADNDYVPVSGVLTFTPPTVSQSITVQVKGDLTYEANESFFVRLSNPTNDSVLITPFQGVGTIQNDDSLPAMSITDVAQNEGNLGDPKTPFVFVVSLSNPSSSTITVNWATSDVTTVSGNDYEAGSGTLTFTPGVTQQNITVLVIPDSVREPPETFRVTLSGVVNATLLDGQGVGTIDNDDGVPAISIADATVLEGDDTPVNAVFNVTLATVSDVTVTVNYTTSPDTAISGVDYTQVSGILSFPPGTLLRQILVPVLADLLDEDAESFFVDLSNPVEGSISRSRAQGIITDNDAPPVVSVTLVGGSILEGNSTSVTRPMTFEVSLTRVSGKPIQVQYATQAGTASVSSDYEAASGTLSFVPGERVHTVTVNVKGDLTFEQDESFSLVLSSPANATLATDGSAAAVATILNDDPLPTVRIVQSASTAEGNIGTISVSLDVTMTNPSYQTMTVEYSTVDGTATAPDDYTAVVSQVLSFAPGQTLRTASVSVRGDTLSELNEAFVVVLSNVNNAALDAANHNATVTITNDDGMPNVSINDVTMAEGNSGDQELTFTVSSDVVAGFDVTVDFTTVQGTATSGQDFVSRSGSVVIPAGQTSVPVAVTVSGDTAEEDNEIFYLDLSKPVNANLVKTRGTGTITNDDAPPTLNMPPTSRLSATEGSPAVVQVELSYTPQKAVSIAYQTQPGTALAGQDYTEKSGALNFGFGTRTQQISIPLIQNNVYDPSNKTFTLTLTTPGSNKRAVFQVTIVIVEDDPVPPPTESTGGDIESEPAGGSGGINGAIVAIPIVLVLIGVLALVAFLLIRRRKRAQREKQEQVEMAEIHARRERMSLELMRGPLQRLQDLLLAPGFKFAKAIAQVTAVTEADKVAKNLVTIFEARGKTVELIRLTIDQEVKAANHAGSLMRANSMASKLMGCYSRLIGDQFLVRVLGEEVRAICERPVVDGVSFEVDPVKLDPSENMDRNRDRLQSTCSRFLRRIFDSKDYTPREFHEICQHMQRQVSEKFPGSAQSIVGGFLFLRYFCPAIITPSANGITKSPPSDAAQRALTLIAKTLQNVANNVTFGKKEQYMEWLNDFINENLMACQDYFDEMATIPSASVPASQPDKIKTAHVEKALEMIQKHLKTVFPKMKDKYLGKAWYRDLSELMNESERIENMSVQQLEQASSVRSSLDRSSIEVPARTNDTKALVKKADV